MIVSAFGRREDARPPEWPQLVSGRRVPGQQYLCAATAEYGQGQGIHGCGRALSNVVDLAMWMRALIDGEVVSADSFRQMTTAVPVRAGFTPPYGFGVSLLPLARQRAVWHIGVMSDYTAVLAYFPGHDLKIAALANARRARLEQVVKDVARALLGLRAPRLRDLPIDPSEAERVGR